MKSNIDSIMISQSNYIPWKGYFDAIASVDLYVIYDEVQFTKRDWRNRNKIKEAQHGSRWLSIPVLVSGKYLQKIDETIIADSNWTTSHWNIIRDTYKSAPFFNQEREFIEGLYKKAATLNNLSDVNELFLRAIASRLNISTPFARSSTVPKTTQDKSERLIEICNHFGATNYFSGPAAKTYIDEDEFSQRGITVNWFDFSNYPEYPQLYPPFDHYVSAIDTIFCVGSVDAAKLIRKESNQNSR